MGTAQNFIGGAQSAAGYRTQLITTQTTKGVFVHTDCFST